MEIFLSQKRYDLKDIRYKMIGSHKIDIVDMVGLDHLLDLMKKVFLLNEPAHSIVRDLMILTKAAFQGTTVQEYGP
jgi:hypothetical protein